MKILAFFILSVLAIPLTPVLAASPTAPTMIDATLTATGELQIVPSKTSSPADFDYLAGKWTMHNKRLKTRLNHCTEWIEYESTSDNFGSILNGMGNMDLFRTMFNAVEGKPYEGLTIRLFNPQTRLWSLYWIDHNSGVMDNAPVVGSFAGDIGTFYSKDTFRDKPILVMFKWDKTDKDHPVWSQSFSPDNGMTWEMNQTNVSSRLK